MKISLLTSDIDLEENKRIQEEIEATGNTFELIDFSKFNISFKNGSISFYPNINSELVIVRGLFSAMRSLEPLVLYFKDSKSKVFDNNLLAHKYSINKIDDIAKLIYAGIPTPDFYNGRSYEALLEFAQNMSYPAVVKTSGAGKGASIFKASNKEELKDILDKWKAEDYPARKLVIQNFIDYEYDLRVLVVGDAMFCMRRMPKEGDFRANFSLGGSVEPFELTPEISALAKRAIEAIGVKVAGVDILVARDGKMYVLEVNHTPGFVGMEKATGQNIGKVYVDYALENAQQV